MNSRVKEHIGICEKKYDWSKLLNGFDANNSDGKSTKNYIHSLARSGDVLKMEMAIDGAADINCADELGKFPIHEAVYSNNIDMVKLLLDNGANIDEAIKPFGHTPLYIAVKCGNHEIAKYLLEKCAKIYVTDKLSGRSLLHIAAKNNDEKMAGILISAGINALLCDKQEMTARDIAAKNNNKELEKILLNVMQHHAMMLEI